jgi:hypothetical protein
MAAGADTPLRFRGGPTALAAALAAPLPASAAAAPVDVAARAAESPSPRLSLALPAERASRLVVADRVARLDVPRDTPPGSYEGTLEIGGETRSVVVDVEPEPFLRLVPPRLVLTAAAGARVPVELALVNLGNVAVEVRGAYAFGLFDVVGVERAIARTFVGEKTEGGSADRLVDALGEEHGGMVRARVEQGAGSVEPGETRALTVTLALPDRLRAGHTYWGTWPLDYLRYYVRVTCAGDGPAADRAAG